MANTCSKCQTDYPAGVPVREFRSNRPPYAKRLCGICALAMTNEIHGDNRKTFTLGSMAEEARLAAVKFKKGATDDHQL